VYPPHGVGAGGKYVVTELTGTNSLPAISGG
jgi:hypothetical protein